MRGQRALAVPALLGALVFTATAAGATGPAGGPIRLFVVPGQGQGQGTIVVTGAIGDYGKTKKINKQGLGEAILQKGTFAVNLAAIMKKLNSSGPEVLDKATCSFVFGATAPVSLSRGTGLYKGISGRVTLTETFAEDGPLYKSGPHKGTCDMADNATPLAQYGSVQGSGTVKFS